MCLTLPTHVPHVLRPLRQLQAIFNFELDNGSLDYKIPFQPLACDAPGGDVDTINHKEATTAFLHGQHPLGITTFGIYSWAFPPMTSTDYLYPEISSLLTTAAGAKVDVPCFVPGKATEVPQGNIRLMPLPCQKWLPLPPFSSPQVVCPEPFVSPVISNSLLNCVKPCPVRYVLSL
jgi:hypothetical protein